MRALAIATIIAIPALLLGFNQLLSRAFTAAVQLRASVDQSYSTRAELMRLLSLHQDLETGQRGYVLTGRPMFLAPYDRARRAIPGAFAELDKGLAPGSPLRPRLAGLRRASAEKIAFVMRDVALSREGRGDRARALVATGEGLRSMDRLRAILADMDRIERAELERREALTIAGRVKVQRTAYILQAALVLLIALAAVAVGRSLASRRRALGLAEDLNARQAAIFENAKDGMVTVNASGGIESINPAAARMFGYDPSELLRRDVGMLFEAAPDRGQIEGFLARLQARRGADRGRVQEFWSRRKDGSVFMADVAISPVPLADGLRYIAVIRDVTERKQVEQMKSEFVSTVSHELRTPLTSIAGSLGLLAGGAAGDLPDRAKRLVTIAYDNCQRLVRLINDILDVEKIESGKMAFALQPVPLQPLLETTVQSNAGFAESHHVGVTIDPVPAESVVLADPDRLVQVITNLLSNAIKYSPQGDTVTISVSPLDRRHRISVADRGPGIPEEFRDRIFGKFAQADSSDTKQKGGTGLGLSIVREIVSRLGGEVGFVDRDGGGTVFHVDLPSVELAGHFRDTAEAIPARRGSEGHLPLVLHVDDDPDTLRIVASAFDGKAQVHSTPSVEEARAAIRRFRYDAAVLDIGMADGSGLDLLPLFDEQDTRTPVVVFTAQDAPWGLAERVDAVLIKSRASLDNLVTTTIALARDADQESTA
jgi:PAS domain S-box-containing protein